MILDLFIVLILIAIILIWLGTYIKIELFSVIGFFFLFLLAAWIILPNNITGGALQYETGITANTTGDITTITYNYTDYNDQTTHYVGYFLAVSSLFGVFLVFSANKKNRGGGVR